MKTMEIYYHDLISETKTEYDNLFGFAEDHNHEIVPIAIIETEDD